jgi:DNA repair exonuclease SbcCD ATPase subunit
LKSSILELNQNKKISGRTYVKWVVLEIHNDITQYNKNGISWREQYIQNNLESIKGMPLCVEFLSDWDKDEPFGHGMTDVKDGVPLFENSVVVGVTENGFIDTIEINGENKRVLIAEGYIYNQRYPKFVQWLKSKMFDGDFPETSVEICAKDGNELIIYEDGWKETGRVPKIFDFSGDAILGIEPADDSAVLLELNNKVKEDDEMKETVVELNNKIDEQRSEINNLKDEVKVKDSTVAELNGKIESKQTELNSTVEELKEVNAKLQGKEKELEENKKAKEKMEKELNELREFKQKIEDQKLIGELNQKLVTYSDEEKAVAKEKIETFNKEPKAELMKEIISEINSAIAQKIVEERTKNANSEVNSKVDDIYSDVYEVNNEDQTTIDELY